MAEGLYSPRWYRVADLKPRLRSHVSIQRKRWRDQLWYILSDEASGEFHRINESAYQFIGRCDGTHSVAEIWDLLLQIHGDAAPSQHEILALLLALQETSLIQFDRVPDIESLFQQQGEIHKRRASTRLNPFAFRLSLGDPDRYLAKLDRLGQHLFTLAAFWIWVLAISFAFLSAASHEQELNAYAQAHLASPAFFLIMWLVYPALKLLHETGHGMAVRRWGGEVHEAGIALLLLVPAPYVNASAATGFIGRQQRALVSAAGIMVELAVAAIALLLWLQLQDGLFREIMFALMLIGSLSTLFFNGNPLLRFDAYYALCDAFDLPNLASRSRQYWQYLLKTRLLGLMAQTPQHGTGEATWLLCYAPLSMAYRISITIAIIAWLSDLWLLLAMAAAVYLLFGMLLRPTWRWIQSTVATAPPGEQQAKAKRRLAIAIAVPTLIFCAVPLPFHTLAPAIIWLPDQAHVRPEVDGFISELPIADGEYVTAGTLLVRLSNPELQKERDQLASRLAGLQAERYRLLLRDPVGTQNQAQLIARTESELERAETRLTQLEIRALTSGRLVMPRQRDLPGRFIQQGKSLAYVVADKEVLIRAAVPEKDIYLLKSDLKHIHVMLSESTHQRIPARISVDTPAATRTLPSPALGDRGGGPYLTNPADQKGTLLQEPVYLIDLRTEEILPQHIGERAWARFDHGNLSMLLQLYRQFRQTLLQLGNRPL